MSVNPAVNIKSKRGALVRLPATGGPVPIPFQYNPSTVKRSLTPNQVGGTQGDRSLAVRFVGAPTESISFTCQLAADDSAPYGGAVVGTSIEPMLASLALLAYPSVAAVDAAQQRLDRGMIDVLPLEADRLILVWTQPGRPVPVRLTSLAITEQLFDSNLTPVVAEVEITLQTLTYSDVGPDNRSYHSFLAYQAALEQTANGS